MKIGLSGGCARHGGVKNRFAFENIVHLSGQVSSF